MVVMSGGRLSEGVVIPSGENLLKLVTGYNISSIIFMPQFGIFVLMNFYTDHAGLEISINSRIASPFSLQIAICNAGPTSALESMGAKPSFCCHFLNICLSYKQ